MFLRLKTTRASEIHKAQQCGNVQQASRSSGGLHPGHRKDFTLIELLVVT